jgi:hypothetical protein
MPDLLLLLLALLPLLAYVVRSIGARWEGEHTKAITVSVTFAFYSAALYLVISEVSSYTASPFFEEPNLSILWLASNIFLIILAAWQYHGARYDLAHEEDKKVEVVSYVDQQLAGRLKPLEGGLTGVQNGLTDLSEKVLALSPKVEQMSKNVNDLAITVLSHKKALNEISEQHDLREAAYREIANQYNKWYSNRAEADLALTDLNIEADDMLTRCYIVMDEMDELIDLMEKEPPASEAAGPTEEGTSQGQIPSPPASGQTSPVTRGKLTKLQGMANRERGNKAQLKFAEEVLRGAGKLLDNSIKEGTPDYIFWAPGSPETRKAKAVGAFKALTLKEDGTRQRHIPRRKVLAELRMATKYAVPMILFVMNFTNGRIWAKVIPVNELKDFTGLTTPLMLVEGDPQAEKTCKETLQMALNLL